MGLSPCKYYNSYSKCSFSFWLTTLLFTTNALKDTATNHYKKIFAIAAALLFVSHPLATQSVTYIVQRLASLVTLFYLLTITLYVKGRVTQNNIARYACFAGALLAAILAMFTKENAFTLPFAIILVELFFLQSAKFTFNFSRTQIAIFLAACAGFIFFVANKFSLNVLKPLPPDVYNDFNEISSANYLFTQFSVLLKYIQLLFLPINQNFDYDISLSKGFFEIKTILSFVLLVAILVWGIWLFNKNRIISFGIFWFFLTNLIESSIIPISDLIFEHRTYMPSVGFFLALIAGIFALLKNKNMNIALGIFGVIILVNSVLTYQRNFVWKSDFTLWSDIIKKSPDKARAYVNRGKIYNEMKQYENAIVDLTKAAEVDPRYELAYTNRGFAYKSLGNWQKGLEDYTKSIEIEAKNSLAYSNRGNIYVNLKQWDKALADYNQSIKIDPDFHLAYLNRAFVYNALEQWQKALDDCNVAIKLNPKHGGAYASRGPIYVKLGNVDSAIADYNKAIELNPTSPHSYFNRGSVYLDRKEWEKAYRDFSMVLQIEPKNSGAITARDYAYNQLNAKQNP
ncbi:MAG: tetratricopeptide repeat protein [Bacteroidetes bacterium]|nr:tetratricopeptide repeat protein [Bacteroidota bacterium]